MEADTDEGLVLVSPAAPPDGAPRFAAVERCTDFSRDDVWRALRTVVEMWRLMRHYRPCALVTTGAAPGLIAIGCARLRCVPCLWIDSLANTRQLSLSGRLARLAGARVVSQWPEVAARHGVGYEGRLL